LINCRHSHFFTQNLCARKSRFLQDKNSTVIKFYYYISGHSKISTGH
jgi:hypothetical protein